MPTKWSSLNTLHLLLAKAALPKEPAMELPSLATEQALELLEPLEPPAPTKPQGLMETTSQLPEQLEQDSLDPMLQAQDSQAQGLLEMLLGLMAPLEQPPGPPMALLELLPGPPLEPLGPQELMELLDHRSLLLLQASGVELAMDRLELVSHQATNPQAAMALHMANQPLEPLGPPLELDTKAPTPAPQAQAQELVQEQEQDQATPSRPKSIDL